MTPFCMSKGDIVLLDVDGREVSDRQTCKIWMETTDTYSVRHDAITFRGTGGVAYAVVYDSEGTKLWSTPTDTPLAYLEPGSTVTHSPLEHA